MGLRVVEVVEIRKITIVVHADAVLTLGGSVGEWQPKCGHAPDRW